MHPKLFLVLGLEFFGAGAGHWIYNMTLLNRFDAPDFLDVVCICIGLLLLDIYRLKPSASHTLKTLFTQYMFIRTVFILGKITLWHFNKLCRNCVKEQNLLLQTILKTNKNTKYGVHSGLQTINTVKEFRKRMPLTSEVDYKPFVESLQEDCSDNVFFPGEATYLGITSGTTSGRSKYFPKGKEGIKRVKLCGLMLSGQLLQLTGLNTLKKWADIKPRYNYKYSRTGIRSGPLSEMFQTQLNFTLNPYCRLYKEAEALFVAWVFALSEDISVCSLYTCSGAVTAFELLEEQWEFICDSVRDGELPDWLHISTSESERITGLLRPNPDRAKKLREEFQKGFQNIVQRVWPSCCAVTAIKTGTWLQQVKVLRRRYIGDLPVVSLGVVTTETNFIGLNLDVCRTEENDEVTYVMAVNMNFYEFIPESETYADNPSTLLAHEVEEGEHYEVVITSPDGLYRYRTADIIKITGFYTTAPKFQYVRRRQDILSLDTEQIPEKIVFDSVYSVSRSWDTEQIPEKVVFDSVYSVSRSWDIEQIPENVVFNSLYSVSRSWDGLAVTTFTSVVSTDIDNISGISTTPPCVVVFLELEGDATLQEADILLVDEEMCRRHNAYAALRKSNRIRSVELKRMRRGTFVNVKQILMNPDTYCLQYKLPRVLKNDKALQLLLQNEL